MSQTPTQQITPRQSWVNQDGTPTDVFYRFITLLFQSTGASTGLSLDDVNTIATNADIAASNAQTTADAADALAAQAELDAETAQGTANIALSYATSRHAGQVDPVGIAALAMTKPRVSADLIPYMVMNRGIIPAPAAAGGSQVFSTAGSITFTTPPQTSYKSLFVFTVTGGGGAGAPTTGSNQVSSGGSAGGTSIYMVTGLRANLACSGTVGSGGTSGNSGNASSITVNGVTVTANGGTVGLNDPTVATGVTGGTATGGTINVNGGDSFPALHANAAPMGGSGGGSYWGGGGAGGITIHNDDTGNPGPTPGAGGGGAASGNAGTGAAGGSGGDGIITVFWVI